jgi:hypothetical protein
MPWRATLSAHPQGAVRDSSKSASTPRRYGAPAVYRLILEDIAETRFERDESDRLTILSMLDRYPVGERAALDRLLLSHLDDVVTTTTGVKWQFRRTILDGGYLQLAFDAFSSFSELHREAFGQ